MLLIEEAFRLEAVYNSSGILLGHNIVGREYREQDFSTVSEALLALSQAAEVAEGNGHEVALHLSATRVQVGWTDDGVRHWLAIRVYEDEGDE